VFTYLLFPNIIDISVNIIFKTRYIVKYIYD